MSAVLGATTLLWTAWLRRRGATLHGGVKMLGAITLILIVVGFLTRLEQESLRTRTDVRTVEGTVTGYWKDRRLAPGSLTEYRRWEGFSLNGVAFSYQPLLGQNYFHDSDVIRDGMV